MTMTYKTITGQITLPGSNVGVRAKVTATPLTTNAALTYTDDDRITVGAVTVETSSAGNLPTFQIPTNVDIGELYWRITAELLNPIPGAPKKWTVKSATQITGSGTTKLKDLLEVDTIAVDAQILVNLSDLVTDAEDARDDAESAELGATTAKTAAETAQAAAAGSATAAAGSASSASTSAGTATTKAGEAAASATAADASADAAAADRSAVEDLVGAAEAVAVTNDTIMASRAADPESAFSGVLSASFAQRWRASTTYTAGQSVCAPDGSLITRNADGTSRPSFDATEQAAWTVTLSKSGTLEQIALALGYSDASLVGGGSDLSTFEGSTAYVKKASGTAATDQARVQAAVDRMDALGGGLVQLAPATKANPYQLSNVVIPSKVVVRGAGILSTYVKVPNSAGAGVQAFISQNFDTLTGTNKWLTSDGVPYGFGVMDLTVDGNKSGRSLVGGSVADDIANAQIAFYGKNLLCDGIQVINSPGDGWYSECATIGGQSDETDLPEGYVGRIRARSCEGVGVHVRGPHDGRWGDIIALGCGREGWVVEGDGATYNGTSDVDFVHSYSNGQRHASLGRDNVPGVRLTGTGAGVRVGELISESNYGPAIDGNAGNIILGTLFVYNNYCGAGVLASDKYHVKLTFQDIQIGNLRCDLDPGAGGSAVLATGSSVQISNLNLRGYGSTGIGFDIDASNVKVPALHIADFHGAGAHAIRINKSAGRGGVLLKGTIFNCSNGLTSGINGGTGNMYLGLDYDVRLGVSSTNAAHTAHNLDTNFTTTTKPANSKIVVVPRDSVATAKLTINTLDAPTKSDIGLGNVDNTSDASKPISTLTQAALDKKADIKARATYRSGWWLSPTGAVSTFTPPEAETQYEPIIITPKSDGTLPTITELVAEVVTTAGSAGAVVRFGVHAADAVGQPGALVADLGAFAATSAGIITTGAISVTPPAAGLIFLSATVQGGATTRPTMRCINGNGGFQIAVSSNSAVTFAYCGYKQSGVTGALGTASIADAIGQCIRISPKLS